jgi:formamidopyrimidine-DNA glycosylase
MHQALIGKEITAIEIFQPKNLNIPVEEFTQNVLYRQIVSVRSRGKWLYLDLSGVQFLLINLGMGGDLLYFSPGETLPEKYKFKLQFKDGSGFTVNFWWFGYIHLIDKVGLKDHKMTSALGLSPLDKDFTLAYFKTLLNGRKGRVKSFLLNQKRIAGIGNVYVQDILFRANLHPNRKLTSLTDREVESLYASMRITLLKSIEKGGLIYEQDFYGNRGTYSEEDFLVAYKTGKPCPLCSTPIEKIRVGSTASYICPLCQKKAL